MTALSKPQLLSYYDNSAQTVNPAVTEKPLDKEQKADLAKSNSNKLENIRVFALNYSARVYPQIKNQKASLKIYTNLVYFSDAHSSTIKELATNKLIEILSKDQDGESQDGYVEKAEARMSQIEIVREHIAKKAGKGFVVAEGFITGTPEKEEKKLS